MRQKSTITISFIVIIIGLGCMFYYFNHRSNSENQIETSPAAQGTPADIPPQHYQVPTPPQNDEKELSNSSLENSDASLHDQLIRLLEDHSLIIYKNLVRNFVVFVDNLTTSKLPKTALPVRRPDGEFLVQPDGFISPENYRRYSPYIDLAETINIKKLARLYIRFYPLIQTAYAELGNNKYFNDRLMEVIDDLLQTPTPTEPIRVNKLIATYEFQDENFEGLSVGQKILIRMGPENSQKAKKFLKNLREALGHLTNN